MSCTASSRCGGPTRGTVHHRRGDQHLSDVETKRDRDGIRLDIREIKSPIVSFCSRGDNITPPQQALDWILDKLPERG